LKRHLEELSFDGEMLVEMNENQQDLEDEAVRLFTGFAMHFPSTIMMTMKNLVKPNEWRLIKFEKKS
jgi:hypothetical protein